MTSVPLTVAVVSWNTRDLLARCLAALGPDAAAGRADVWVVDNGSTDGSSELVASEFSWATLLAAPANLGFGAAVNMVAERTSTRWIAPANADTAPEAGAVAALLERAESDPRAGVVAPRLILPDGSTQHSVYHFPTVPFTAVFNAGAYRLLPSLGDRLCLEGRWDPEVARPVDWAIGAFVVVRREAFDAVGGFDAGQWMYAEDLDLGWRLARAGWRTLYEPRARVLHASGAAAEQAFGADRRERWMAATYTWMATRRGRAATTAVATLNVLGAAARAALAALRRDARARREAASWARIHARALVPRSIAAREYRPR